jgi:hypothetical protein
MSAKPVARRRVPVALPAKGSLGGRVAALVAEFKAAPARWRRLAIVTFGTVAVLAILGALYAFTGEPARFKVSGEIEDGLYIPVLISWALLFGAGLASFLRSRWGITRVEQLAWFGVGVLFTVMAFDELLMVHERLENRLGIDWQLLYLPVFAAGGTAWLALLRPMRRWSLEQVMWIAAAALWFVSEIQEKLEFTDTDEVVNGYKALDGTEKVMQFTGSTLFLLVATLGIARLVYSGKPVERR